MSPWVQITLTCVLSLIAWYAGGRWKQASRSSADKKRLNDIEATVADLESSFSSLLQSHARLRSRQGMRELRERRSEERAPETKAEARRRIFGNAAGPAFAQRQRELESANGNRPL